MEKPGSLTAPAWVRAAVGLCALFLLSHCNTPAVPPGDVSGNRSATQKMFYSIDGLVTDTQNRPLEGVVVVIVKGSAAYPEIAAVTNEKGAFSLGSLEKGTYTVQATYSGQNKQQDVTVGDRSASVAFVF
jgi:hypothetical protein